jgi:hypothetical protein
LSNLLLCQRVRASVKSANDEGRFRSATMTPCSRLTESSTLRDVSGDQYCGVVMGVQGEMGSEIYMVKLGLSEDNGVAGDKDCV